MAALSTGHLATDLAQGSLAALLPFLVERFDLSYAMAAALVLAATISSSIVQPLFGLVSDAKGGYWLLPVGVAVAGIGMALAAVAPSYPLVLVAVLVAGLGVAAYHPEASKFANYVSGDLRASGMAFFSVGGNLGFALGPVPRIVDRARARAERRSSARAPRARGGSPPRRGPRPSRPIRARPRAEGREDRRRGQSARALAAPGGDRAQEHRPHGPLHLRTALGGRAREWCRARNAPAVALPPCRRGRDDLRRAAGRPLRPPARASVELRRRGAHSSSCTSLWEGSSERRR